MKVLDILESYNTRLDLNWNHSGDSLTAFFNINNEHYDIRIDQHTMQLPTRNHEWDVYEISFRRIQNDSTSTVKQTPSKYGSKVFGIIYNGILEKINHDLPDCVIFSAKLQNDDGDPNVLQSRVNIYSAIAKKIANHGIYDDISPINSKYAINCVLMKHNNDITNQEIDWIKQNV